MPDTTADLRQMATNYRDHLKSELAKVEQFLEMADQITKASENMRPAFSADGKEENAEESVLNLFAGKPN